MARMRTYVRAQNAAENSMGSKRSLTLTETARRGHFTTLVILRLPTHDSPSGRQGTPTEKGTQLYEVTIVRGHTTRRSASAPSVGSAVEAWIPTRAHLQILVPNRKKAKEF